MVLLEAANTGGSVGLGYHLLVDALAQPAAHHGVPVEMPMPVQQAGFAANGGAEGLDTSHKVRTASRTIRADADPHAIAAGAHARLRSQRLALPDGLLHELTALKSQLLMRYGRWLEGLASGELTPLPPEQARFVDVTRGKLSPAAEYERVWARYRSLLAQMRPQDGA